MKEDSSKLKAGGRKAEGRSKQANKGEEQAPLDRAPRPANRLSDALGLAPREHVALVGAGGKTNLLFALAEGLQGAARKVVTCTTTKVWHRESTRAPSLCLVSSGPEWRETLRRALLEHGHVFLGTKVLHSGKVEGVAPALLDTLYHEEDMDYLLVEADGAAGHPVKAPVDKEPVVPCSTTSVVALLGLEALGLPMSPEVVFRLEAFERVTGIAPGKIMTPAALAALFYEPEGLFKGAPDSSRRVAFLNKKDLLSDSRSAGELAHLVLGASARVERVVMGSVREGRYEVIRRNDG